jgi:hypothetical protein
MAIVYRHIRLDTNQPFYIGAAKNINRAYSRRERNIKWRQIVAKTEYLVEMLFEDIPLEKAYEKEMEFIKIHGREDLGEGTLVNMTDGALGSIRAVVSTETIAKRSVKIKGVSKPWQIGKPIWPGGSKLSEEHKAKLRKPHKPLTFTSERINADMNKMKEVYVYNIEGHFIAEYGSVGMAAKELSVDAGCISKVANGVLKKTKGYVFKYEKI